MSNYNKISKFKKENPHCADMINEIESYYNMILRRINHEFGNALTLVSSSLQIIESSHPEVHDFKYWNSAMEDVRHLVNLVSEISTYNNSTSIKTKELNIMELSQNIIDSFSINPSFSHITYSMQTDSNIPLISGDSLKLRQALINLIKNASESITQNGSVDVHISLSSDNTFLTISVSDTGCGMTEEQLANIFSPMVSYKPTGTGLGLPIIKKIIEAHNGFIDVTSIYGKGSIFTISLPTSNLQTETTDQEA